MRFSPYKPEKIFIEKLVREYPLTKNIIDRLPRIPVEEIDDHQEAVRQLSHHSDPIGEGKRFLLLARQQGRFFKPCPGTTNYICCGYRILNIATNCDIDCTYCILQGYLNNPLMTVYVNTDDLLEELDQILSQNPNRFFRIGTGELTDSLTLDHITEFSKLLVPYFSNKSNAVLELKTKTTLIDNLLNLEHGGRTVVSWSLNSEAMIDSEESQAPSLDDRLLAAQKCQQAGYKIGFHFDPLIYYPDWENGYRKVVDRLFDYVDSRNIVWISFGALRYPPQLDGIIRQRHPHSKIVYGELFPGKDGKLRYFKPIRIEMFQNLHSWIKKHAPDVFVYLCMESSEVWQKALGWTPGNSARLACLMDATVAQ